MQTINIIFQLICYYIAWFTAMYFAAGNHGWYATLSIMLISTVQLVWQSVIMKRSKRLWFMIILFTSIGFCVDTLLQQYNIVIFAGNPFKSYSPPWMIMIWANFAILFYSVLKSYFKRYSLIATLSFVFFPVAYVMGAKLGAAHFPMGYWSSVVIGIVWAILFPLCMFIYNILGSKHG